MARYDAYNAECVVLSYREGLLSRLAHDLRLRVERFCIEVVEPSLEITATFDPTSLRVQCAVVEGRDDPSVLSAQDRKKIDDTVARDVLHVARYPEVRFQSTEVVPRGEGYAIEGPLVLHGRSRPIQCSVRPEGDQWVAETTLNQPDFGIKPFTAALGALKVQPRVRVCLRVPRG